MREYIHAYTVVDGHSFVGTDDEEYFHPGIDLDSPWTAGDTLALISLVAAPLAALPLIGASGLAALPGEPSTTQGIRCRSELKQNEGAIATKGIVTSGAAMHTASVLGTMSCAAVLLLAGFRRFVQPLYLWATPKPAKC
ncbi:hypothetical protein ONZ45_g15019 [Pleurotus djamor]|nr:hypothetical protein ONZ45_g15019 [Pleurotus djamor]